MLNIKQLPKDLQKKLRREIGDGRGTQIKNTTSIVSISGTRDPEAVLKAAVEERWPGEASFEFKPLPNRRFRIDIAFIEDRLAVEVDGWVYHGKYKLSFQKDRIRQNLLVIEGWRVLRFFYGEIDKDIESVLDTIAAARQAGKRSA